MPLSVASGCWLGYFKNEVEADEKAVKQIGIAGVPFFLVNDQISVRGVQTPEHLLSILNQAWQAQ